MANRKKGEGRLPTAKIEDVEYSRELADQEDREAIQRADEADTRQEQGNK